MTGKFVIAALGSDHDRSTFSSGVDALDRYLRQQVSQDIRRRATACYVAIDEDTTRIAGYYTLAAAGVMLGDLPESLREKLPRYPSVPVARMGRLAIDLAYRGRKLGAALLWDATMRSLRSEIPVFALVVDAKDDQAKSFYLHHGFTPFGTQPRQLVLPLTNLGGQPSRTEPGSDETGFGETPAVIWLAFPKPTQQSAKNPRS